MLSATTALLRARRSNATCFQFWRTRQSGHFEKLLVVEDCAAESVRVDSCLR
jgi:hypothetical protein